MEENNFEDFLASYINVHNQLISIGIATKDIERLNTIIEANDAIVQNIMREDEIGSKDKEKRKEFEEKAKPYMENIRETQEEIENLKKNVNRKKVLENEQKNIRNLAKRKKEKLLTEEERKAEKLLAEKRRKMTPIIKEYNEALNEKDKIQGELEKFEGIELKTPQEKEEKKYLEGKYKEILDKVNEMEKNFLEPEESVKDIMKKSNITKKIEKDYITFLGKLSLIDRENSIIEIKNEIEPSQSGPSQPEPSQSGPSRPGSSQPGPSQSGPSQSGPSQPEPSQSGPSRPGPSQLEPSQPKRLEKITYSAKNNSYKYKEKGLEEKEEYRQDILNEIYGEKWIKEGIDKLEQQFGDQFQEVDKCLFKKLLEYGGKEKIKNYVNSIMGKEKWDNDFEIEYDLRGLYNKLGKGQYKYSLEERNEMFAIANAAKDKGIATVKKGFKVAVREKIDKIATRLFYNKLKSNNTAMIEAGDSGYTNQGEEPETNSISKQDIGKNTSLKGRVNVPNQNNEIENAAISKGEAGQQEQRAKEVIIMLEDEKGK